MSNFTKENMRPTLNVKASDYVKPHLNVGCLLDVPTGEYFVGKYGESILNGGQGLLTGITAFGNAFKSTLADYLIQSSSLKMVYGAGLDVLQIDKYDTEMNVLISRMNYLLTKQHLYHDVCAAVPELKELELIGSDYYKVSDASKDFLDKWFSILKEYLAEKRKNRSHFEREFPFLNKEKTELLKYMIPTQSFIDSATEAKTSDILKIENENDIGESGRNTIFARQNLGKAGLMSELPYVAAVGAHYLTLTAHYAEAGMAMGSGPGTPPPRRKLRDMKPGERIKGVTERFFFLMTNCWLIEHCGPLQDDSTKTDLYPHKEETRKHTDLMVLRIKNLRGKAGPTGQPIQIVLSERNGIMPSLTEFHYIKGGDGRERFGLVGNLQNYSNALLPDVKLSRTTVREKLENSFALRRAMNIVSEMAQIQAMMPGYDYLKCSPEELYSDIKERGYDWDMILNNTRGWYCPNNDNPKLPLKFLSTVDLLKMRKGMYKPYWLK